MKKISLLMMIIISAVAQEMRAQVSVWDGHSKEWPPELSWHVYSIRNAAQFAWLIDRVGDVSIRNHTFLLETDLDMGDRTWIPLGHRDGSVYEFASILNGQGHSIRINIDGATANYQGLIASISVWGSVTNLHVIGRISCSNSRLVGGIAGWNDGNIENCWVSADVSSGWREPASAYSAKVGGIAGENTGLIEYCCMTGNVTNNDACVGGLVGYNHEGGGAKTYEGVIRHCTFYGSRSSSHSQDNRYVGSQGGTLENVYDRFDQGEYDSDGGRNVYRQAIKYPYALKFASVGNSTYVVSAGGEEGASATRPGQTVTLTKSGTTDMVRVEIKDADGDDIGTGGNINGTLTFTMPSRDVYIKAYSWSDWPKQGSGSSDDPYLISNAEDWNSFANNVSLGRDYKSDYIKLASDITVSTMAGGSEANGFHGTFNGAGHTLTFNKSGWTEKFVAPFRCVKGVVTIKNLKTAGSISSSNMYAAGLVASIDKNSTYVDVTIENCHSSMAISNSGSGNQTLSGLVGRMQDGGLTIRGCVFDGSLSGANAACNAGFVSWIAPHSNVIVEDCLFAPSSLSTSTDLCATFARKDVDASAELRVTHSYYTQSFGTEQGTLAVAATTAPSTLGKFWRDYGMVTTYANGIFCDGTYYMAPTTLGGSGTVDDPHLISSTYEWNSFVHHVNSGTTYSGKYVQLTSDISVSTMVGGSESNPFSGTFLGNGHTITAAISDNSNSGTALFRYINGATIKNLKVAGTITGGIHAAAIAGIAKGTGNVIENCVATASVSGGTHIGGILGHGTSSDIAIRGCVFSGTMTGGGDAKGALFGWGDNGGTKSVTDCLYLMADGQNTDGLDLVRQWDGSVSVTNCYKSASVGSYGTLCFFVPTAPANLGTLKHDYGMMKAYENGILHNYTYYMAPAILAGSGTADNPYLIRNIYEWNSFAYHVANGQNYSGQYVKLTADIEITDVVGVYECKPFSGTFLGEGHTLTANIRNTDSGKEGVAPFRYVKDATIRDVTVGGTIDSNCRHTSGLVGFADGTNLIEGCTVNATLNISTDYAGGIVGHGLASATTIRNCVFAGTFNHVGGTPTNIGAIWGWSDSGKPVLENCLEKGTYKNVSSMHPMGLQKDAGSITNCYYLTPQIGSPYRVCTVSGACQVWPVPDNRVYKKITAADGKEYALPCTVGGVEARYNLADLSSITPVVTDASGAALTLGTDYSATLNGTEVAAFPVAINTGGDYTLTITGKGAYGGSHSINFSVIAPLTGSGTAEAPYLISTTADWLQLANTINEGKSYSGQYVKLTADIEISEMVGVYEGKPFSGTFLGEGHTLTANIKNTDSGKGGVAPFRYVKDATIRDVTVGGTIESNGRHATGLVGFADGTNLIEGCTVNATLNISTDYAGGIVGHGLASATTIRNCVFAGTFNHVGGTPTNIGAIWGWSDSGNPVLENCLEKGTYKNVSSMHPMGLQNGTGTITNCYYVTPQIGSPDRACTVSGACQVSTTNTGDGIYRQITLAEGTYYIVCYFSGVERWYLYTGSDITIAAPTITAANGTKLTAGTDFTYTPETVREMGDYTLTISGKGSYTGTKTFPISVSDQREVTSKSTVLTTGDYIVSEDVTIAERITIDGSVVLNLGENAKLTASKGIELSKGNSLTINGPGSLNISDVENPKSGIGSVEVGTLVINSGSIEISVFSAGAAIGGDKNNTSGGSIIINGGKISITNDMGKCIGGGLDDLKGQYGVCGDIVINGGQVDLVSTFECLGPGIQYDDVTYKSGTLTLGWTNPDDYIRTVNILGFAQDLSLERISFVEGRPFVLDGTTTVATADNIVGTKLVPLLALADNGDNSETLSRYAGAQLPVQLVGRTLYRDGSWNTLCLPFGVTLSGSPLEGATARPLTSASISGTTLNLVFGPAVTELVAGTPYIIKWAGGDNIVSPVFSPVTIDNTDRSYDNGAAGDARVRFIGTYANLTFDAEDKSILFMGGASRLHYPATGASIGAQRAYFCVGDFGLPSNARITTFNIDFGDGEATGIQEIVNRQSGNSKSLWYTLDGRRLDGKPTQPGVYINGGRKVVIK